MDRNTSIIELKGVGEKTQKLFAKLNLYTVGDLLAFYPRDYENFREPVTIERAGPGEVCAVRAVVAGIPNEKRVRNLHILNVNVSDGTGNLQLTFFNMPFLKKKKTTGETLLLSYRFNIVKMQKIPVAFGHPPTHGSDTRLYGYRS